MKHNNFTFYFQISWKAQWNMTISIAKEFFTYLQQRNLLQPKFVKYLKNCFIEEYICIFKFQETENFL